MDPTCNTEAALVIANWISVRLRRDFCPPIDVLVFNYLAPRGGVMIKGISPLQSLISKDFKIVDS